ncbi:MAG TPA: asparagine synthase (glutamine-hydrolyzing) [Actinoplanes sp.]
MCGIAGVAGGPLDSAEAFTRAACARMAHRGPDREDHHRGPGIALGMCRLSIIGGDGGAQPAYSPDRRVVCVVNGEIYNYRALREHLERAGRPVTGIGDAHVIPALYELYGDSFVDHLVGMFAIALHDGRTGELKLITDRVGKKPLFYATVGGGIAFASELAPLAAHPAIPAGIDPLAIDQYLSYRVVPAPHTIYAAIRKLPPASILTFRPGAAPQIREYWQFDFTDRHRDDPAATTDRLDELLTTAVADRLESEVPLGAMLSGGLDSSLVVAIASKLTGRRLNTFSVGFEEARFDESAHARVVAEHCGTRHHTYRIGPDDARTAIDAILSHIGEPYAFPSAIASYYMYRLAKEHVTVVLTGDGADEIFAGYRRYRIFRDFPAVAEADRARVDMDALARAGDIADRYEAVLIDGVRTGLRTELYSPAFRARLPQDYPINHLRPRLAATAGRTDDLSRLMQLDSRLWLPDAQLVKIDRMAMAHSVEPRSPMLDHRLIDYVTGIPSGHKLVGHDEKAILKRVAARYLPDQIVHRDKQELAVPLETWLSQHLRPLITATITSDRALDRGYFRPDVVRRLAADFRASDSYALWTLFMLERWHELFLDAPGDAGRADQLELSALQ